MLRFPIRYTVYAAWVVPVETLTLIAVLLGSEALQVTSMMFPPSGQGYYMVASKT
jgi:hypothetical protein